MSGVDVYPVGALLSLRGVWNLSRRRMFVRAWRVLAGEARTVARLVREGRWRPLRNHFNGFLAEPTPFPEDLLRCGSGWTRGRALRSLHRHGYRGATR